MNNILKIDNRLDFSLSKKELRIPIKKLFHDISVESRVRLTCDDAYYKENICLYLTGYKLRDFMDSMSCLYGTSWEISNNEYILLKTLPRIQSMIPEKEASKNRMIAMKNLADEVTNCPTF